MSRVLLSRLLAVLAPVLVVGAMLLVLTLPEPRDKTPKVWDHLLRERRPYVVVLGNSIAQRDVDVPQLAEELGIPASRVAVLTVPLAGGSLWYAALKNRILPLEKRPKLVIVAGELTAMLGTLPITEESGWLLASQLTWNEPVIAEKVYGGGDMRWIKLKQRRGEFREWLLHRVRDVSVGLTFGEGRPKHGRLEARPAMERVFADENLDYGLLGRVIPIVEREPVTVQSLHVAAPRDSLVPDLCTLGRDAGIPVVFARVPLAPSNRDDDHPLAVEVEVVSLLNELGCGFLDLRQLGLTERHFWDKMHMNEEGAALFTHALAVGLTDLGVRTGEPLGSAEVPLQVAEKQASLRLIPMESETPRAVPIAGAEPPEIRTPPGFRRPGPGGGWYEVPELAFVSDGETARRLPVPRRCSPVRVEEDGILLPEPRVACTDVKNRGHGRQCHVGKDLFFSASDGSEPNRSGHAYRLVLDPDRRCRRLWWLYPGDSMEIAVGAEDLAAFVEGIGGVEVDVVPFQRSPAANWTLDLEVWSGENRLAAKRLEAPDFDGGPAVVGLAQPRAEEVRVKLANPSPVDYSLVTMLALLPPGEAGVRSP